MYTSNHIGLAVKSARLASCLSAKQLADRSGLTASALSKIESGKQSLSLAEAAQLCSTLGIKTDHLLALAREVEPLAAETATLRAQLRNEIQELQKKTIKAAIAVKASEHATELV